MFPIATKFALEKPSPDTQAGAVRLRITNFERMATANKNWVKDVWQTVAFFGAYLLFAVAGALVSVLCLVPAILFHGERVRFFGQRLIHLLFRIFIGYVRFFGLVELDAGELPNLRASKGLIIAANHPCLFDAVLMVSQMPQAVCLMKGVLARNVIFSGTSQLAGYINNKSSLGLVHKCRERLNEGANLLVFPEGTRTVGGKLQPFKMGFALVAVLTQSPVQTVIITAESNHLGKGQPLLKKPSFPLRYSLRLGQRLQPEPGQDAKKFGALVENYFQETLSQPKQVQPAVLQSK